MRGHWRIGCGSEEVREGESSPTTMGSGKRAAPPEDRAAPCVQRQGQIASNGALSDSVRWLVGHGA